MEFLYASYDVRATFCARSRVVRTPVLRRVDGLLTSAPVRPACCDPLVRVPTVSGIIRTDAGDGGVP
jgi:hypothetical protein